MKLYNTRMGLIDIKNISGDIRFSTDFNVGSIGRYSLGKEDYITLPFNVLTPINFKMGDYVDLSGILDESLGGKFAKIYEVVDLPTPTYDQSTGGYNYELRLDAYYWKWKNKKFKYMPEVAGQEASWNLTASLDMQLGVFLRNLQALGYKYRGNDFDFSIDSSVEDSAKLMSYENTNLLDALTNMAETWNCEWWVEDNIIRFGRCENGDAVRIELGVEAQEMPRSESQGTYATRVYAFGSTRNIPSNYRTVDETVVVNGIVQKRLMLPEGTPYIDAYRYKDGKRVYIGEEGYDIGTEMPQEEAIEDIIFLDEVYPRTECVVGTVGSYTSTIEDEETQETVTQTFYYVTDTSGLVFDESYIIDGEERVHMAHIDIHYSSSVNGVASLHTEILKNNELHHFYEIYPEKFNNKTNGITFRRWLLHCNPQLTELITSLIGDGFKKDATQLEKLLDYKNNEKVLKQLLEIKSAKKMELKKALMEKQNVTINENSIFDIQIKRLHEYKRQQLNALYVIHKYLEIKAGKKPSTPITVIFGAKAAPAYIIAQDIIHLILCLQQLINNDPEVSPYLNVVMVENYNVTWAEKLIPACDISEQISLASKEASGTGNMKFMLNGALTLGTEDGANVEIHELVGDDNIYIFGDSSDTVVERYAQGSYHAAKYYNENAAIKEAVDFITGEELKAIGDKDRLERLFNELVSKDWFMTFPDFDEYVKTREQAYADYENREEWVQKMLVNIAKAGYFSSDRTIEEYNRDIWKLED